MRTLSIACGAVFALAVMASPALAANNLNSSKSNLQKIDASFTETDCTKKGGTVSSDQEGKKVCTMPGTSIAVTDPESSDVGRGDKK
jgi:hypothetical protein